MKRWIHLAIVAVSLGVAWPSFGAGLIIVDEAHWWPGPVPPRPVPPRPIPPPWPPHPLPPRQYAFAPLELSYIKVDGRITEQVAVTTIEQEFHNPNAARLEGTFLFPVPRGAHIDKFTMEINGKPAEAELLKADKARGIYEDIVRKLKDPALLEYSGRDVFKVRIFPIEPNSNKRIMLSYTQLLKSDNGLVNYVLPLNTEKYSAKPVKNVSLKLRLESKQPLKSIYSPSHKVEIKRDGPHRATVGFESDQVQPDTDFALYFAPKKDEIGLSLLTHRVAGENGYFLLLASPGVDVAQEQVVKKDVVFVLDTSGSMVGKKLEQAKKALLFCIENLNQGDRFELIRFSTEVEPLFSGLVEVSRKHLDRAEEFVKDLKPIGGTAIDEALKQAVALGAGEARSDRPCVVIFLTDGRPTIGTTDEDQILAGVKKANSGRTRVFSFGIGTDVNTHLLDKITEETRAFSQYVLPDEDLEIKVSSFFSKIKEPVLANPQLKFTGGIRATSLYPSPLPDLFKGEQLVLLGRYTGKGDSAVVISGTINGQKKQFTYEVSFSGRSSDNDFIPRLWAMRRVGYLLDEIRLHGENAELKDEVTELARKYSIVTPYTAYLIVEDEARREVPLALRSMQRLERDQGARDEASLFYRHYNSERGGMAGVSSSRQGLALKSATAAAPASTAAESESLNALGLPSAPAGAGSIRTVPPVEWRQSPAGRLVEYSQQAQFVNGKTFFQNEKQWIDPAVQKLTNAKRVRIQFASTEYFELAAKEPVTAQWLALGQNVQFVHNNTIYDIYE